MLEGIKARCARCGKEICPQEGYYNLLAGPKCESCGDPERFHHLTGDFN